MKSTKNKILTLCTQTAFDVLGKPDHFYANCSFKLLLSILPKALKSGEAANPQTKTFTKRLLTKREDEGLPSSTCNQPKTTK